MKQKAIQLLLFILTLITTTLAGAEWQFGRYLGLEENPLTWEYFWRGMWFSVPFLGFLTVHEFGHYFMARRHRVRVTLPYYLPLWLGFLYAPTIGTLGAVIRIKDAISTRRKYFDIGIAGPLAGFVMALGILFYGFTHLPPPEYIYEIHPEYEQYGPDYAQYVYNQPEGMHLGTTLLFEFFKQYVASPEQVPNAYELFHYPWLLAGFLSLFFTALNLIPIGQLDGGHIVYGLVGYENHRKVSAVLFIAFITYAGLGLITPGMDSESMLWSVPLYVGFLYVAFSKLTSSPQTNLMIAVSVFSLQFLLVMLVPTVTGYPGWLLFGFLIGRVLGVYHPRAMYDQPLDTQRKVLGWLALVIFVLCFSPSPFVLE